MAMKRLFSGLAAAAAFFLFCFVEIRAQDKNDKLTAEITVLRQKLITAIKERDRKTLETLYANDFTHTHASGQVDDKTKRIAALVSGDLTIESAKVDEINIRFYGKRTAVAVGQSTIDPTKYRWTLVYVKSKNRWQIAASQATRLAEK